MDENLRIRLANEAPRHAKWEVADTIAQAFDEICRRPAEGA